MASIKVKFRPSSATGGEGCIYYQIIHNRKVRQLSPGYKIYNNEWNEKYSKPDTNDPTREKTIAAIGERIQQDMERLNKIDREKRINGNVYSADCIINEFKRQMDVFSIDSFTESRIESLRNHGRQRTADCYSCALKSFKRFLLSSGVTDSVNNIMIDIITPHTLEAYEAWLKNSNVTLNSISCYMRTLRAIYNRAVDAGAVEQQYPFRHVYTGIGKTVKRSLTLAEMKRLKLLDLSWKPQLEHARDIFLLSFYLRGMSFIDMAFLEKDNLRKNHLTYRRHKTGQRLEIAWTKEMQEIVNKYPRYENSPFLLPILLGEEANRCYRNVCNRINRNLKGVAELAAISIPLTTYCARHSWASIAKATGVPTSVISDGMGHDSERTTQIYLASLDTSIVDRANSKVIASI